MSEYVDTLNQRQGMPVAPTERDEPRSHAEPVEFPVSARPERDINGPPHAGITPKQHARLHGTYVTNTQSSQPVDEDGRYVSLQQPVFAEPRSRSQEAHYGRRLADYRKGRHHSIVSSDTIRRNLMGSTIQTEKVLNVPQRVLSSERREFYRTHAAERAMSADGGRRKLIHK